MLVPFFKKSPHSLLMLINKAKIPLRMMFCYNNAFCNCTGEHCGIIVVVRNTIIGVYSRQK